MSAVPEAIAARISEAYAPERVERIHEPDLGLTAYIILDSCALGPAAGGIRTKAYDNEADAALEACRLARAMTYKCALGGVDAGGGKAVVLDTPDLQRDAAFERLGEHIDRLDGDFRTAGDLGTRAEDLAAVRRATRYVHTNSENLSAAVARSVVRCAEACADHAGRPGLSGLRAAVQGCGDIGSAVAVGLIEAGATVCVADIDAARAAALAEQIGATVVAPEDVLYDEVDLLAPCAVGDVLHTTNVRQLRAWMISGGANNICADVATHRALFERDVIFVPDLVSSAGAVIEGVGRTVMGLSDCGRLIDALRQTARLILDDAKAAGAPPLEIAIRRAQARIDRA